jgi:uncharacterized membrane protein YhaH (DUF805 family)
MTSIDWATLPLKKYADFTGRARRKEYWLFVLLCVVAGMVAGFIDGILGLSGLIGGLYGLFGFVVGLALLVPSVAVAVRRLHDTSRSGWWLLIGIVPYLASVLILLSGNIVLAGMLSMVALGAGLVLLVFMILEGTKGPNSYGPDPLEGERTAQAGHA